MYQTGRVDTRNYFSSFFVPVPKPYKSACTFSNKQQIQLVVIRIIIMSSSGEGTQHMTCTDELNNMHIMGIDEIDRCAACGKEGKEDNMNSCNKCKMVKYCNVSCKKKHKSKHKKKCDKLCELRAAELHEEVLFGEPEPPPREECPICMLPLPFDRGQSNYQLCCGKNICNGCIYAMVKEAMRKGKKNEEVGMCPYCRTLRPSSNEEKVKRIKRLMEKGNADAFYNFAVYYNNGSHGLQQDMAKAAELWLKASELGCAKAYFHLGCLYAIGQGVDRDEEKAKHYKEVAAMKGDIHARHNLGCVEGQAGNYQRAYKHWIIAARAGHPKSLDSVKTGFINGFVTKDEHESTLRAYHERQSEMKSETRDQAIDMMAQRAARRGNN